MSSTRQNQLMLDIGASAQVEAPSTPKPVFESLMDRVKDVKTGLRSRVSELKDQVLDTIFVPLEQSKTKPNGSKDDITIVF